MNEDSRAFHKNRESMPPPRGEKNIPLRGSRPSKGDLERGNDDFSSDRADATVGKFTAFAIDLAMTRFPCKRGAKGATQQLIPANLLRNSSGMGKASGGKARFLATDHVGLTADRIEIFNSFQKACKINRCQHQGFLAQGGRAWVGCFSNPLVARETKGPLNARLSGRERGNPGDRPLR